MNFAMGKLGRVVAAGVVLAAALAAGCGRGGAVPTAARPGVAQAKAVSPAILRSRFKPRPVAGTMWRGGQAVEMLGLEEAGAVGALPPLPVPTPTPGIPTPPPPPPSDEIDELRGNLAQFGYRGSRQAMIASIRAAVTAYPVHTPETPFGWDPSVKVEEHYQWWKPSFPAGEQPTLQEYREQALMVAQHKFDVVFYVWISKQTNPAGQPHGPVGGGPWVDFNEEIPVVKAIGRDGWMVNLNAKGNIVDYFRMPEEYLSPPDFNHVMEIPRRLCY